MRLRVSTRREQNARKRRRTRLPMYDALMLILGIGSFALFLGYVTVCEHL